MERAPVELAALCGRDGLAGFLLSNRWPDDTQEWADLLLLAVRVAAVPGLLPTSTVFRVREDAPKDVPGAVAAMMAEGTVHGAGAIEPAHPGEPVPAGLVVLHPPGGRADGRVPARVASGCVLLPGLPHLGLEHRAAWATSDGESAQVRLGSFVDPGQDVDTAVLALLLAA